MESESKQKKLKRYLYGFGTLLLSIGIAVGVNSKNTEMIQASTPVTKGDFRLTADNKWDNKSKNNYADLNWDKIDNLSTTGYKLSISEDGRTWDNRSLNYGKAIKVLNIYPDIAASNTLKSWMDSLDLKDSQGANLIQVTSVSMSNFNKNPEGYLKDSSGDYQYNVMMFGSWDANNAVRLPTAGYEATQKFIDSGRGVLFGHDTIAQNNVHKQAGLENFLKFRDALGIGIPDNLATNDPGDWQAKFGAWTGSTQVKIINDGYLMKYPFELPNQVVLTIPYAHSIELSKKSIGTVWAEFINPSGLAPNPIYDDANYRGGWYLKSNNNLAMIQTGHSNGSSTTDERKIIANVLYNLAQVSIDNKATDYSVKDDQAPEVPSAAIRCGDTNTLNILVNAKDNGKKYQWYVEADTKDKGLLTSDTVEETITSNIAGYFYQIVDKPTTDFKAVVEAKKDSYGRIAKADFDLYVAPDDESTTYSTAATFRINETRDSGKYLQVIAVDRMSNVSEVSTTKLSNVIQYVDFEVERTGDETKLVNLKLDDSLGDNEKSLEIQIPTNAVLKDVNSLILPTGWKLIENSVTTEYKSVKFSMGTTNDLKTINTFVQNLRVTLGSPTDQAGTIRLKFSKSDNQEEVELTNSCWSAAIPQKVFVKAYDEQKGSLPDGDQLFDQQLRINQTITIQPTELNYYEFLEARELNNTPRGLNYIISDTYQQGKLIYSLRQANLNIRQVILNPSDQLTVPKQGYVTLQNRVYNKGTPTIDTSYGNTSKVNSEENVNSINFTSVVIGTKHQKNDKDETLIQPIVPSYYKYQGYYLTKEAEDANGSSHAGNTKLVSGPVVIPRNLVDAGEKLWITLYLEPTDKENTVPNSYSWDYKLNEIGKINID